MWDFEAGLPVAGDLRGTARAMAEGTVEVLETMFFELPIGVVAGGAPPRTGLNSVVEFGGVRSGWLEVHAEPPAARRLAASFLGREDDRTVTKPEVEMVLLELVNMLCRNALSRIEPQGGFRIAAPRLTEATAQGAGGWLVAPLESGRLAVRLHFLGAQ